MHSTENSVHAIHFEHYSDSMRQYEAVIIIMMNSLSVSSSVVQVPFPLALQLNIFNIPQHGTAAIQVTEKRELYIIIIISFF